LYATQREREEGEKRIKVEREYPAGNRLLGVVYGKRSVSRLKAVSECDNEARQRARV
jgi:hypothetical protein